MNIVYTLYSDNFMMSITEIFQSLIYSQKCRLCKRDVQCGCKIVQQPTNIYCKLLQGISQKLPIVFNISILPTFPTDIRIATVCSFLVCGHFSDNCGHFWKIAKY